MSRTYKAIGINLKSMPMGEADRLLTILTREFGLVRAVAMGSRKHNSSLGGRSGLFVVNELLIAKGRSLDKIAQAETLESYPGLSQNLQKLTASQYLAELCLCQALSDQPQEELFYLSNEHLKRLERSPAALVLPHLTHAVFQLLVLSGVAPQVHLCCATRQMIQPDLTDPNWRIGFSIPTGGVVTLEVLEKLRSQSRPQRLRPAAEPKLAAASPAPTTTPDRLQSRVAEGNVSNHSYLPASTLHAQLTAIDLALLQQLAQATLPTSVGVEGDREELATDHEKFAICFDLSYLPGSVTDILNKGEDILNKGKVIEQAWQTVERILRYYAQYHFDRPIRSATLIDACFAAAN